jgi:hypothetical protein
VQSAVLLLCSVRNSLCRPPSAEVCHDKEQLVCKLATATPSTTEAMCLPMNPDLPLQDVPRSQLATG